MKRRELITLLGGTAAAWPLAARAQRPPAKIPRIDLLTRKTDTSVSTQIHAFRQGLQDLGWVEGKSISIEYRDAEGQLDRLRALAAELVALNVDVIVTVDTPPTQAAKQATSTIPIVIAVSADPVGAGLVRSLSPRHCKLGGPSIPKACKLTARKCPKTILAQSLRRLLQETSAIRVPASIHTREVACSD